MTQSNDPLKKPPMDSNSNYEERNEDNFNITSLNVKAVARRFENQKKEDSSVKSKVKEMIEQRSSKTAGRMTQTQARIDTELTEKDPLRASNMTNY